MYSLGVPEDPILIPVNEETRFRVQVLHYDVAAPHVSMTCEYHCIWCLPGANPDRPEPGDDGTCRYCDGKIWRSSPDEGTSLPVEKLNELIDILTRVRDEARQTTTNDK